MIDSNAPTVVFRELPGIAEYERRCEASDRMMKDELAELDEERDRLSMRLFGITYADTLQPYDLDVDWPDWVTRFNWIEEDCEYEELFWEAIGIDMTNVEGDYLCCLSDFGRQITCVVHQLHPAASFRFRKNAPLTDEQSDAAAEAWGRSLLKDPD